MESGRIDESIRWANKAVEIDPRQPSYQIQIAHAYATLGDINMAEAYLERAQKIVADDMPVEKIHILRALILMGNKEDIPMQQVLDTLEPIGVGRTDRMEIEANLAIIRGEAKDWLASHAEYLSECLNAQIDEAYAERWRDCGVWLDGLLQAAGDEERARAAAKMRIEWGQIWVDFLGHPWIDPRDFMILGEEAQALDGIERFLGTYRGNPQNYRLFLDEDPRFMLYHDPVLGPIRDHPRFQALVAEVEADLAQQLENVREMEHEGELPTLEEVRAGLSIQ
jgi:tetratricopeptide (TPR) repeat protein